MKSLMPIALDYNDTNLSRVPVARRLQDEARAHCHREERGGQSDHDGRAPESPGADEVAEAVDPIVAA